MGSSTQKSTRQRTTHLPALALCLVALCAAQAGRAQAVNDAELGARARVARLREQAVRDATASATTVELGARSAAAESVSDVIVEVPGARPFRTGSLGSFTSASLRGAELDHTAVLLGSLPLSGADAAAFDLSTVPASLLDRVVVYRGGAPVWLSQGSIGGVLQLQPRRARTRELSGTVTVGSHGLLGGEATSAVVPTREQAGPRVLSAVGLTRADGDFPLRFDNETALNPSDDRDVRRRNAGLHQGQALLYGSVPALGGSLSLLALGFGRTGGEPGSSAEPAFQTSRRITRAVAAAAYDREHDADGGAGSHRLQLMASGRFARSGFSDPFAEVGVSARSEREDITSQAFGRVAGSLGVTNYLELTALGSAEREWRAPHEAFSLVAVPDSRRTTLAGAGEARLHASLGQGHYELRPSVRVAYTSADLSAEVFGDLSEPRVRDTTATYRVAAAAGPLHWLTFGASVASGQRMPSMLELFGDGALIAGNVTLGPERSLSYDASAIAAVERYHWGGRAELRAFALDIEDMIVFVPSNVGQQAPRALGEAHIRGIEAGLHGHLTRHLRLSAAATVLDTEDGSGRRLQNRPRLGTHLRPELRSDPIGPLARLSVFWEFDTLSGTFDDPSNAGPLKPDQLFVHAGTAALLAGGHAEVRLTVRDVLDAQGNDLRGFLLPGRTLLASFTYRESLP